MEIQNLYERDFYAWIQYNIELLKCGKLLEINTEILIDELESMAKRDKRELISHLIILLAHLLKWQFQLKQLSEIYQNFHGSSWKATIIEQRMQIMELLEMSPSLKPYLSEALQKAYPKGVEIAHKETELPKTTFPKSCPYLLEQILQDDFYPSVA
ncbi:MAG: DUF29 domain-containing protein [Gammaproteobacteria bacterium]|nr:MAG: DUF29 domain-containing protein [Gammaproteobacteria bacterium]